MKVVVFVDFNHDLVERKRTSISSLTDYFDQQQIEYQIIQHRKKDPIKCDLAIIWGIPNKYKPKYEKKKVYQFCKTNNIPLLVLELGFIRRDKYYSFGYGGIVGFANYYCHDCPSDRFEQLNMTVEKNKHRPDGYILLCGQVPWDTQLQHINYIAWAKMIVKEIKKHSNKEIIFRPHPCQNNQTFIQKGLCLTSLRGTTLSSNIDLIEDFKGASVVVAFNSNCLLDALLYGLPIFAFDKGSCVYHLANHDLSTIDKPSFPDQTDKMQTLYNIAYQQWTIEELRDGQAWNHVIRHHQEEKDSKIIDRTIPF